MTLKKIECHDLNQHAKILADYFPGGDLFAGKNIVGTKIHEFIVGMSHEHLRCEGYLKALQDQFLPDNTENFIPDWEKTVGIPDDCFDGRGTIEERRRDILVKLASLGVQTAEDFENLALQFGVTVNVTSGTDLTSFPLTFPITFIDAPKFTIVVEFVTLNGFPYTFPITFGSKEISILECLFNKLKPANCQVIFKQV